MALTQADMDFVNKRICLPIILLLDYTTFLYLVSVYKPRYKEFRVRQLFLGAFTGFAVTITFARGNSEVTQELNDVSETCAQLMFLLQITIIGRDVQTKVKLRSIQWCTVFAELLIALDWLTVIATGIAIAGVDFGAFFDQWSNVLESFNFAFVLFFRFYYLSISRGFWHMARRRKTELLAYVLLMTHEYPWYVVDYATGISWEYVQGIYQRSLIAWCICLNRVGKRSSLKTSSVKSRTRKEDVHTKRHSVTTSVPKVMTIKSAAAAVMPSIDQQSSGDVSTVDLN